MAKIANAILCLVLASVLLTSATAFGANSGVKDKLKQLIGDEGVSKINTIVGGNWSSIDEFSLTLYANSTNLKDFSISQYGNTSFVPIYINGTLVNGTEVPPPQCPPNTHWNSTAAQCVPDIIPPPPVEICGDGIDNDGDGLVDEGCPITPPTQPDKPTTTFNGSKWIRLAVVGDVDNNNGLATQISLAQKYHANCFVVPGDYGYSNGQAVIDKINNGDFDCVVIDCGNHDNCSQATKVYGQVEYKAPMVAFYLINAGNENNKFDCSSAQYNSIKDQLTSSDAYYNIPVVHQPFVTGPSTHGGNGQFACWDPLFRGNGVENVLQAHNHNYQRFNIDGIIYGTYGTGTHDTGSSMYPIKSDAQWNGHTCDKCITGTNGVTIMDLKIDDPAQRLVYAWFLSNSEQVKDKWVN